MISYLEYFPLLICLIGLALWFFLTEKYPKGIEAGRLMFFAGLLGLVINGFRHG